MKTYYTVVFKTTVEEATIYFNAENEAEAQVMADEILNEVKEQHPDDLNDLEMDFAIETSDWRGGWGCDVYGGDIEECSRTWEIEAKEVV